MESCSGNFCVHAEPVLYRRLRWALSCLRGTKFSPAPEAALSLGSGLTWEVQWYAQWVHPHTASALCCGSGLLSEAAAARWLVLPLWIIADPWWYFSLAYSPCNCPKLTPALGMDLSSRHRLPKCLHSPLMGVSDEDTPEITSQKPM